MIDTYNNIGISLVAFLAVCKNFDELDYSKALLINPILLHNQLAKYIKNKITIELENLMVSKIEFFLGFNKRYYAFLGLSINTIIMAEKMKFIKLEDNKIIINKNKIESFKFNDKDLGNRAKNIIEASTTLSNILKEETKDLYSKLRIEI